MGRITISLALASLLFTPGLASAQVVISEIMYNPDGGDAGREWVELYNAGSDDISMTGGTVKGSWRISDSSNHTFTDPSGGVGRGSLAIPAGGYLVVASDPSSFMGDFPNGSFSVVKSPISLNNTGATIALIDGNGTTLDSVSYAKDQGAYDDGTSLQKTSSGSWIAAPPTPGSANATIAYAPPTNTSQQSTSSTQTNAQTNGVVSVSGTISSYVPPPTPSLFADAGGDRAVIVGADSEFDAHAYDGAQHALDTASVRFSWNFGDGATAEGQAVLHHWEYPGTYAIVLSVAQNKTSVSDTIKVTAESASVSLRSAADGSVTLSNSSKHNIDLSQWIISDGSIQFILPPHSILLANLSTRVSPATLGFSAGEEARLEYPNGALATSSFSSAPLSFPTASSVPAFAPPLVSQGAPLPAQASAKGTLPAPTSIKTVPTKATKPIASPEASARVEAITSTTSRPQTAAAAFSSGPWWYVSALTLVTLGSAALLLSRKRESNAEALPNEDWNIIEEASE